MSTLEDAARAILERWDSQQDMDTKAGEALFEALRAALAEATAPVVLESVELQRDTSGMCTVLVNGRVAIRDNGDVISHHATLDWFSGVRAERAAMEMLRQECDDGDALLRLMGLDPEQYRTEGGSLNLPKIRTALAEAQADAEPVAWRLEAHGTFCLIEDGATAARLAPLGFKVAPLYFHPPRRELSERHENSDEVEVLAGNQRADGRRLWADAGAWLYPGDRIVVLRAAGGEK